MAQSTTRFETVLRAFPNHPIALYGLGVCHIRQDAPHEAVDYLTRAAQHLPPTASAQFIAELYLAMGLAYRHTGQQEACARCYRIALMARPGDAQAWFNQGNVQSDGGLGAAATRSCRRALQCRPNWSDAWNNLGRLENDLEHLIAAVSAYRRALLLDPAHRFGWNNLGIVGKKQDDLKTAIACFERAIVCRPDWPEAVANLGRNLLLVENFTRGWAALSHSWRRRGFEAEGGWFKHPVWDGGPLPPGKALLVWCNDKIGDEILYVSFLPEVLARAGRVIFLVNPRLYDIFTRSFPGVEVVSWDRQSLPDYDRKEVAAFYPLDFIASLIVQKPEDLPPPRALLKANRDLAERYKDNDCRPRIGLCWQTDNTIIGSYRSQALTDWRPILQIPDARFFSLQYGDHDTELEELATDFDLIVEKPSGVDQLVDMEEFSAFVSTLDLVISIPSTTVHVAGAIGIPAWVMVPTGPGLSWFWFLEDDTGRWYPNTRLFRQSEVSQWSPVITAVAGVLREWVKEKT